MASASGGKRVVTRGPAPDKSKYPPLVFVHGAFAGAWTWDEHFLDYFADAGFSCLAVNRPGRKGMPDHANLHDFGIQDFTDCVAGAAIRLERAGTLVGETATDAFGEFKFDGLKAHSGTYRVSISVDGAEAKRPDSTYLGRIELAA